MSKIIYEIPVLSQEFETCIATLGKGVGYDIIYTYYKGEKLYKSGLKFLFPRQIFVTTDLLQTMEQVKFSTDTVFDLGETNMLKNVEDLIVKRQINIAGKFKHYFVKFLDGGVYDIIANDFQIIEETKV